MDTADSIKMVDNWCFMATFCAHGRLNGMKHPSDMSMPRFEHGGSDLWPNTLPLDHGGTPDSIKTLF